MPRIAGVDVPNNKKTVIALTYIFGIGHTTAQKIVSDLNLDPDKKAKDLTEAEVTQIATYIDKTYQVEGQLRRHDAQNIIRLKKIGCYRGIRHGRGLPVRGQRTRTNARTRKGRKKSIAVKRQLKKK